MLYIAEVSITGDDLTERMNRMRAWLDHQRLEPGKFRLCRVGERQMVRVSFNLEREAAAFASEFGGSVLCPAEPAEATAQHL